MMCAGAAAANSAGGQAAVRLHQLQRRLDAERAQPRVERGDVGAHHRLHIGVDHRRAGARIFLDLRQDLVADRDRDVRQRRAHRVAPPRARAPDWRSSAAGRSPRSARSRARSIAIAASTLCRIQRHRHASRPAAASRSPPAAADAPPARAAWSSAGRTAPACAGRGFPGCRGSPRVVISAVRAPLPSRTVLDPTVVACSTSADPGGSGLVRSQQRAQAVDDAFAVVVRRGGDLVGTHAPVGGDRDQVGEGAADIDPNTLKHAVTASLPLRPVDTAGRRPPRAVPKRDPGPCGCTAPDPRDDTASPATARPADRRPVAECWHSRTSPAPSVRCGSRGRA